MKHFLTGLFLLFVLTTQAQNCPKLMQDGNKAFTAKKYKEAVNIYMAVMVNCPDMGDKAKQQIEKVFDEINQLKDKAIASEKKALDAQVLAEQQRAKAESMVNALMPNEAKTDPFAYFWRTGKKNLSNNLYEDAYIQILLTKEAANKPANMSDSVELLYKKAKPLGENYKNGIIAFYKNDFTEARKCFAVIKDLNPTDTLSLFMYYACGDYQTENMVKVEGGKFHPFADDYTTDVIDNVEWTLSTYHIAQYEVTNAQYARFLNEKSARF